MQTDDTLTMSNHQLATINEELQTRLQVTGKTKVGAVEAAGWLAEAGLLEQGSQPGVNLRKLRAGQIREARQEPPPPEKNGSWFIGRVAVDGS